MLPVDWPFLPLVKVAGHSENSKDTRASNESAERVSDGVHRGLEWVLILEVLKPEVLDKMLSPTARFCRLACIFLAGA